LKGEVVMRDRFVVAMGVAAIAAAGVLLHPQPLVAQAPAGLAKPGTAGNLPRTPDGKPDLQGVYDAATLTPVERPPELKGRLVLTDQEAKDLLTGEGARVERTAQPSKGDRNAPVVDGNVGGYNYFWINRGSRIVSIDGQWRSSLIVDPADGRVPPQTAEAKARNAGARGSVVRPTSDAAESVSTAAPGAYDDIELRPLAERCIMAFGSTSGPPMLPNYFYNNLKQIVQTPDYVLILVEMVHDARIIRMSDQHAPPHIRKWMGDSIGRWQGDTLVVETTNFTEKTRFRGSSENLKVTERFTRVDEKTILYRFTIEDPTTWERPWTAEYTWVTTDEPIYEYACHEGNYSLQGIMKGERLLDSERTPEKRQ
jgi:hypothetical protein